MKNEIITINNLINKKILVWGYGLEGKSAVDLLLSKGIKNITVATKNKVEDNRENVFFILESDILKQDFDCVIKSSGISMYKKECEILKSQGTIITSTLNLLLSKIIDENKKVKVIAITGTKGKSTTSSILYHMLNNLNYKVALLGNIGMSFLDVFDDLDNYDYLVLELSSYQIKNLHCEIDYSIILNLFPEHIDWHLTHENYFRDKVGIVNFSKKVVFNISNELLVKYVENTKCIENIDNKKFITFGGENGFFVKDNCIKYRDDNIFDINSISNIKGEHIFNNICGILTVLNEENINLKNALSTLQNFKTLRHRLDVFYNDAKNNTIFVNDSISTIPEATIEAIKTFKNNDIFLILGGFDRQQDYSKLIEIILQPENMVKKVFLIGETGKRLMVELGGKIDCCLCENYEELVKKIKSNDLKNKTVLLSPASASYDMFDNFERRGEIFEELMKESY